MITNDLTTYQIYLILLGYLTERRDDTQMLKSMLIELYTRADKAEVEDKTQPKKLSLWWECERCGKMIPYMADFCNECANKLLGEPPKPFESFEPQESEDNR